MKEIFYCSPNLTHRKEFLSIPETKLNLGAKYKPTQGRHMELTAWKLSVNIKSTESLYNLEDFMKKWSGPPYKFNLYL